MDTMGGRVPPGAMCALVRALSNDDAKMVMVEVLVFCRSFGCSLQVIGIRLNAGGIVITRDEDHFFSRGT